MRKLVLLLGLVAVANDVVSFRNVRIGR